MAERKVQNSTSPKTEKQSMTTEEMLEMISKLTKQVEILTNNEQPKPTQFVGVAKMDKPCTLIHLIECTPGLPTTIKVNNNEIRFSKFGEKRTFRFAEMQDITSRYRDWFERGIFTLGEDCDEFENDFGVSIMNIPMPAEKHKIIASLPLTEFKQIVNGLSEAQALFLAKTWVDRYIAKVPGYDNLEKVKILNKKTKGFMKEFMTDLLEED